MKIFCSAVLSLYCSHCQLLLVCGSLWIQFCLQLLKIMFIWVVFRGMTWPLRNTLFLCLEKLFVCFCSLLWVIIHLSIQFCSIYLNLSRDSCPAHFRVLILLLLWAVTSSINTTGSHSCTCLNISSTILHRWCDMSCSSRSSYVSQNCSVSVRCLSLICLHLFAFAFMKKSHRGKPTSLRVFLKFFFLAMEKSLVSCTLVVTCGLSGILMLLSWPVHWFLLRLLWPFLLFLLSLVYFEFSSQL